MATFAARLSTVISIDWNHSTSDFPQTIRMCGIAGFFQMAGPLFLIALGMMTTFVDLK